MNIWDFVLVAGIAVLLALAVWTMRRSHDKDGCASCPFGKECSKRRQQ